MGQTMADPGAGPTLDQTCLKKMARTRGHKYVFIESLSTKFLRLLVKEIKAVVFFTILRIQQYHKILSNNTITKYWVTTVVFGDW